MASAFPPSSASSTGVAQAPPSTNAEEGKHSTITHAGLGTRLTHLSRPSGHCFVNPPVQRGSTVLFPTVKERNASWFDRKRFEQHLTYGINGSETHHMLENMIANIEGGTRAQITSSGLSACTVALLAYTKAGNHVLLPDSIYGPVRGFAEGMLRRFNVDVEYYHASASGTDVAALLKENTTVVYIESPGSHTFEVVDVRAIARVARAHGATSILDNTYGIHFFRPFEKGEVDVSVQALTKYVVGHSDALLGAITVNNREDWERVRQCVLELGEAASPDDCWLAIRGARTLGVRLRHQMEAGLEVARYLSQAFPEDVVTVLHPALPSCPGHEFYLRDYTGCCSLFSVVFHPKYTEESMHAMLDSYHLFAIGASWGGFESLVLPTTKTITRSIEPAFPLLVGPTARYHVGLEEVEDLKADLRRGFEVLRAFDNGTHTASRIMSLASSPPEAPSTIYHLAQKQDWEKAVAEERDYFTDSLEKEGFTHATAETKLILTIANAFYQSAPGDFVLLVIDTPKLSSKVVMEKGDAPLPGSDDPDPPTSPHIFGKIEQIAVRAVKQVTREEGTGKFLSIEME